MVKGGRWLVGAGAGCRARGGALELNLGAPSPQMEEYERKQFCLERSGNRDWRTQQSPSRCLHPSSPGRAPGAAPCSESPLTSPSSQGEGAGEESGDRCRDRHTDRQAGRKQVCQAGARRRESPASGENARLERTSVRKTEKDALREHSGEQVMYSLSTLPAPHTQKPFTGRPEAMRLFYPDGCTPQGLLS